MVSEMEVFFEAQDLSHIPRRNSWTQICCFRCPRGYLNLDLALDPDICVFFPHLESPCNASCAVVRASACLTSLGVRLVVFRLSRRNISIGSVLYSDRRTFCCFFVWKRKTVRVIDMIRKERTRMLGHTDRKRMIVAFAWGWYHIR